MIDIILAFNFRFLLVDVHFKSWPWFTILVTLDVGIGKPLAKTLKASL